MPLSLFLVKIPLPTWVFFLYKIYKLFFCFNRISTMIFPETALESQDHLYIVDILTCFSICEHEISFRLTVSSISFL